MGIFEQAIQHALCEKADIVCMSWGFRADLSLIEDAMNRASMEEDIIFSPQQVTKGNTPKNSSRPRCRQAA